MICQILIELFVFLFRFISLVQKQQLTYSYSYIVVPVQKQPPEVFYKKCVLKSFAKFTGKHLRQSLCFNKVAGLTLATLLEKRLWHWCFPVNFAKCLRTPFLQNSSWRLLLFVVKHICCYLTGKNLFKLSIKNNGSICAT